MGSRNFRSVHGIFIAVIVTATYFTPINATAQQPGERASGKRRPILANGVTLSGDWGYVNVREGAHMFWWFEPCKGCPGQTLYQEPLVIWLQGGPGASSMFGLFTEVGPYQIGWKPRKNSWADKANLLFVDNPVGTGFSYVDKGFNFTRNNTEIVDDLMVFLKEFVWGKPEFHFAPIYLVCESYGGKMGIEWARRIVKEQREGFLPVNFKGVALGDSWISPVDFVEAWVPQLKAFSLIDDQQQDMLSKKALDTAQALKDGNGTGATALWSVMQTAVENTTDNVDFYNLLLHNIEDDESNGSGKRWSRWHLNTPGDIPEAAERLLGRYHEDTLEEFLNGDVKDKLGYIIPEEVVWGKQSKKVFKALSEDFMSDVVPIVDDVLETGLPVTVYNGQLDLICCTLGVYQWLARLNWTGLPKFQKAPPVAIRVEDDDVDHDGNDDDDDWHHSKRRQKPHRLGEVRDVETVAFVKAHANLALYTVLDAGHMVPSDQPDAALQMLSQILGEDDVSRPGKQPAARALPLHHQ